MADKQTRNIHDRKAAGRGKKPGDRTSGQQNRDGDRSLPLDAGFKMERFSQNIISLKNCSNSEATQLMSKRWADAMNEYDDPKVDLSVRPIMYYGGSVWGKLPHQIQASQNKIMRPTMSRTDYLTEVRKGLLGPRSSSSSNN